MLRQLPTFRYLFISSQSESLSIRKVINLLKPNFSEEGSNSLKFENDVYALFIKYLREVAGNTKIISQPSMDPEWVWGCTPPHFANLKCI